MASPVGYNVSSIDWRCTQTRGDRIEFEWTIKKFHLLPHKNVEAIYSPAFPHNTPEQWKLELFPRGDAKERAEWIAIYLYRASDKLAGVKTKYEIIISQFNKALVEREFTYTFETRLGYGTSKMIERSKLSVEDGPIDTITIHCKIEILGTYMSSSLDTKSSDMVVVSFNERRNQITKNFKSLYKDLTLTDFTVISGKKKFPTHKVVMASRSPVFAAMFQHKGLNENVNNQLRIKNIKPAVVEGLLEFIYTDDVSKIEELAHELLAAADQYGLEDLTNLCEETLFKTLDEDNAADLLALADLHNAHQLKKYALQYITAHLENVVKSEAFKSMNLSKELSKEIIFALALPSEKSTK